MCSVYYTTRKTGHSQIIRGLIGKMKDPLGEVAVKDSDGSWGI